jgi:peptidoglycan hydrolase CwlO-like protein
MSELTQRSAYIYLITQFTRVRSLSIVLQDVEIVLPERELADAQQTQLDEITQGCRNVLEELEKTLDRYHEIDSSGKSFGEKSRRVWKRLKWDQKEIDGLRSRITSNTMLFNTFLGRLSG